MKPRGLLALIVLTLAARTANAEGGSIDIQAFRPAVDSRGFITVNASQILGHKEFSFGLVLNWGSNVLELEGPTWGMDGACPARPCPAGTGYDGGVTKYEVSNIITPNFQFAIGLKGILELGLTLPVHIVSGDAGPDYTGLASDPKDDRSFGFSSQGLGDVGLHAKVRVWDTSHHPFGIAVLGSVYYSIGESDAWLGEGGLTVQPSLILDKELGKLRIGGNIGFRLRTGDHLFEDVPDTTSTGIMIPNTGMTVEAGPEVPFGGAIALSIVDQKFDVIGEIFGGIPLGGENYFPVEVVGGAKLYLAKNSFFLIGGGVGLMPGASAGNPDIRAFMGIVFEPNIGDADGDGIKDDVDKCPTDPEDKDDFEDSDGCPDPDNDDDGIPDKVDRCPDDPENKNKIEDEDGCPEEMEFDRDGDGIMDSEDDCPDDPEDFDNFKDEDGCPELDNDEDGLNDVDDDCPMEAEDYDGWKDDDGCPELDNDDDRVTDTDDQCPGLDGEELEDVQEVHNGTDDEDGCPDKGKVIIHEGSLEILDKIYFKTDSAEIEEKSYDILNAIGATLVGNPDIELIEIQGHADERGDDKHNKELTDDRAHAVLDYLANTGVDKDRMQAKGYGEEQPIAEGHSEKAWSQNRRVEFVILKRAGQ